MASRYFGSNQGQHLEDIVEGAASPGKDVEIKIDLARGMSRSEVLIKIEELEEYMLKVQWPPA